MSQGKLYEEIDKLSPEIRLKILLRIENGETSLFCLRKDEILTMLSREEQEKKERILKEEELMRDGVKWGPELPGVEQIEPGIYRLGKDSNEALENNQGNVSVVVSAAPQTVTGGGANFERRLFVVIAGFILMAIGIWAVYYFYFREKSKGDNLVSPALITSKNVGNFDHTIDVTNKIFRVRVDYDLTDQQLVADGDYAWVDPKFYNRQNSVWNNGSRRGVMFMDVLLIASQKDNDWNNYRFPIDENNYEYADTKEFLSFVAQYKNIQIPICVAKFSYGDGKLCSVWSDGGQRSLGVRGADSYSFAVVVKKGSIYTLNDQNNFSLEVNYDKSLSELIQKSIFLTCHPDILRLVKDETTKEPAKQVLKIRIFRIDTDLSKDDVIAILDESGYRVANLRELLVFRLAYSSDIRNKHLIALGSEIYYLPTYNFAPVINCDTTLINNDSLELARTDGLFSSKHDYFLAVKKE